MNAARLVLSLHIKEALLIRDTSQLLIRKLSSNPLAKPLPPPPPHYHRFLSSLSLEEDSVSTEQLKLVHLVLGEGNHRVVIIDSFLHHQTVGFRLGAKNGCRQIISINRGEEEAIVIENIKGPVCMIPEKAAFLGSSIPRLGFSIRLYSNLVFSYLGVWLPIWTANCHQANSIQGSFYTWPWHTMCMQNGSVVGIN